MSLLETMGTRDSGFERAFERVLLDSLLESLEERDQAMVRLYYQEELTQREIGAAGLSQMHISRLLRQATAKLVDVAAQEKGVDARFAA